VVTPNVDQVVRLAQRAMQGHASIEIGRRAQRRGGASDVPRGSHSLTAGCMV
jgi:hypothetical protein